MGYSREHYSRLVILLLQARASCRSLSPTTNHDTGRVGLRPFFSVAAETFLEINLDMTIKLLTLIVYIFLTFAAEAAPTILGSIVGDMTI